MKFIFRDKEKYLIWHDDTIELRNNKILMSDTLESAERLVNAEYEYSEYNIYELEKILDTHDKTFNCKIILDFWNIFNDIVYSFGEKIPDERTRCSDRCYNKLFWGNNLSAVTPAGEHYTPVFTRKERRNIIKILRYGIDFVYKNME